LTVFVAALCSVGYYTHWVVSAFIGTVVMVGGVAGWIVGGPPLGFVSGGVFGALFLFAEFLLQALLTLVFPRILRLPGEMFVAVYTITVVIGGVVGGFNVRPPSRE
jgi:hypothetical protein